MIQIRNLSFQYGEAFQLYIERLDIATGSRVAIVGPSGCGKTTLLNIIAGVQPSQAGEIDVCGNRMDMQNDAQRRRLRAELVGFVFQEFELIDYLTVRDNILLPFQLHATRVRPGDLQQRLNDLLKATGLADRASHFPAQLSQGQRQRAAICRALITQPRILLADEPTGSLDQRTANEIVDLMLEQSQQLSATLVMVTHDTSRLGRFDRVISLDSLSPNEVSV